MIQNKKIIAIIPARGGSKGIPKKNIKPFCGKPLIFWTIKIAKESKYIDDFVVSTDDGEIAEISKRYKARVIKRPKKLARDDSLVNDAISHALNFLEEKEGKFFPIVVLLQPTSPLRKLRTVESAIETFLERSDDYDSLIPLHPIEGKMGKIKKDYYLPDYILGSPRQELEKAYRECGTVFVFKTHLAKKGKMFGKKILPFIIKSGEEAIDIDNLDDFKQAEYFFKNNNEKQKPKN